MSHTYHELKFLRQRFFRGEVTKEELNKEVERIVGRQMPLKLEKEVGKNARVDMFHM